MPWAVEHIEFLKSLGRSFQFLDEDKLFKFGPSEHWNRKLRFSFEVAIGRRYLGMLWFSVVEGDCPPLLSRVAMTEIGAWVKCDLHVVDLVRLAVTNVPVVLASNGHYLLDIEGFDGFLSHHATLHVKQTQEYESPRNPAKQTQDKNMGQRSVHHIVTPSCFKACLDGS